MTATAPEPARLVLPDFCTARGVLGVALLALLVALMLALAGSASLERFWIHLARLSLFLLWVALPSAGLLCRLRLPLQRFGVARATAAALALIVAVTLAASELAWRFATAPSLMLGDDTGASTADHWSFLSRNALIGLIAGGLALRYFYVSGQWRRNVEAEARARVRALQARIRPHFLFNCMNTIAMLTRRDPAAAERAVLDIADLFRANLSESRARIPLAEEIDIARTYQRVEQLRLGDRLLVDWRLDDFPAGLEVPALLLQPLLENAIYHGIESLAAGGTITVTGKRDAAAYEIGIENPISAAASPARGSGNRIGLDSVRERLELAFPERASVVATASEGLFRVVLRLPLADSPERG
jgi:two-component system sensor histidine kinase AlgZ